MARMSRHRNDHDLYFAYGANLNLTTMGKRCPSAVPLKVTTLTGWKMVFHGAADIIPAPRSCVYGALYRITPADKAALDRYEGVERGVYTDILFADGGNTIFAYHMDCEITEKLSPPTEKYLRIIRQGYLDWKLPDEQLQQALLACGAA
jgi:hypothetical protein